MPHLVIEYSQNLASFDAPACLATANAALAASRHFDEADIKSRAYCVATFRVGSEPVERAFVAARLSILSGRSLEAKQDLSQRVLRALQQHIPSRALSRVSSYDFPTSTAPVMRRPWSGLDDPG